MGMGAFDSMKSYNIEPVVTDVKNIEEAVKLYLQGKLPNLMERLH
jgi:predicted Fe-Mo cluster-binding NifX family protein